MKKSYKKLWIVFFVLLAITSSFLYWSLYTKHGFQSTWGRLARLLPGSLQWDDLTLDLAHQSIEIKDLNYTLPEGTRLVDLHHFKAQIRLSSVFRLKAIFKVFEIDRLSFDLSNLPPRKEEKFPSDLIRELSKRISIDQGEIRNISIQLKNGVVRFPLIHLHYQSHTLGNHWMKFSLLKSGGELAHQPLSVDEISYEGEFSFPQETKNFFSLKHATGKLNLKGAHFGKWNLSDFSTEAAFDGEEIDFKGIDLKIGENRYQLKLKFAPIAQRAKGEFSSVDWVKVEQLPGLNEHARSTFEKTRFSLQFNLVGFTPQEMQGTMALDLQANNNYLNPKTPNLSIQLSSKIEKGRFDLTKFQIQSEKTLLTGKGFVDFAKMELKVPIEGKAIDLKTLISFFSDQEIVGYADVSGEIAGKLTLPDFKFHGRALDAGYKFLKFGEIVGDFDILKGDMHYKGKTPPNASFVGDVDVAVNGIFDNDKRHALLKVNFNNLDATALLENPDIQGKISGFYEMDVFHDTKKGKLVTNVKDFHMYQFHVGDMEVEGDLKNNDFLFPKVNFQPPNYQKISMPRPVEFHFSDQGFKFKGSPFQGMDTEGGYAYARQNVLNIQTKCHQCSIAPLLAALDQKPMEGILNAKMNMDLLIGNFQNSKMLTEIDSLEIPVGDHNLTNSGILKIGYRQGGFHFDQVNLALNEQILKIHGSFSTEGALNLQVNGSPDLAILKIFPLYFRDAGGATQADLSVKGNMKEPLVSGAIAFKGGFILPRALGNTIENLKGKIALDSQKINFENLEGTILDGDVKVSGILWHEKFKIKKADLKADFQEIAYTQPAVLKLTLSGKMTLTGTDPHLLLAGDLDITQGRYIKNFDIKNYIIKPAPAPSSQEGGNLFENINIDLRIKSPGEFLIRNNIAEIYLKSDLHITGNKSNPKYEGALEVLDGSFHYFKINFSNAKGVIDFRDASRKDPYVDITAQNLFERPSGDYVVTAHIQGFAENLQTTFSSNPPLENREILALVFTGALPIENQKLSGPDIAGSVLASQLTGLIEQPLTGFTHLDIFRLEASDPDSKSLTSLVVGKRVTERLTLEFKTDLSVEETANYIQAEYLLFDNVLLKASRSSLARYKLDLTLRFKGY